LFNLRQLAKYQGDIEVAPWIPSLLLCSGCVRLEEMARWKAHSGFLRLAGMLGVNFNLGPPPLVVDSVPILVILPMTRVAAPGWGMAVVLAEATFSEAAGAPDPLEDASIFLLGGLLAICYKVEVPVVAARYKCDITIWPSDLDITTSLQMSDVLPQVNDQYAQKEYWCALDLFILTQGLTTSLAGSSATKGKELCYENRALFSTPVPA
jgi:hypothetical protein